ncbi:MAG: hypothetical protein JSS27_07935 [Planctomycetes bacterium]|nr:hypothetical protein [Planctomycetota bacterium]
MSVAVALSIFAACLGGISLYTYFRAAWPQNWLDSRPSLKRSLSALIILLGGVGTLLGKFVDTKAHFEPSHTLDWTDLPVFLLVAVAMTAILVQGLLLKQSDKKESELQELKQQLQAANQDCEAARFNEFFNLVVSQSFLEAIGQKKDSVVQAAKDKKWRVDGATPGVPPDARALLRILTDAMAPGKQIKTLIFVVHRIFRLLMVRVNPTATLRVGYYVLDKDMLKLRVSWDGQSEDCLKSHKKNGTKDRYRIDATNRNSLIVAAATTGDIQVVEDAKLSHDDGTAPFEFWHNGQKSYLHSMVAIPFGETTDGGVQTHVICIDANFGFFKKSQMEQLRLIQQNLEQRLLCEHGYESIFAAASPTGKKK